MNSLLITLVFMLHGQNDFDRTQVQPLLEQFKGRYEAELGVQLRFKVRHLASTKCSQYNNQIGTSDRAKRMLCLAGLARKRFTRRGVVHFLTPPIIHEGRKFLAGMSIMKCQSGVNWSVVENYNSKGEARWLHSITAFAHELGHSLRAEHIKSPTVMHEDALPLVQDKLLDFDPESVQEIRNGCF